MARTMFHATQTPGRPAGDHVARGQIDDCGTFSVAKRDDRGTEHREAYTWQRFKDGA
jgi:hypothetical protein